MRLRTTLAIVTIVTTAAAVGVLMEPGPAGALGTPSSHLVVISMENKERSQVVGSSSAPYINHTLIPASQTFDQYYAITHPSLPNYLALTSGSFQACTTDSCPTGSITGENLFSQLSGARISWKVYSESMTTNCQTKDGGPYLARHNPAVYYANLTLTKGDGTCGINDVPFTQLATDLAAGTLPSFAWITPNQFNDMHAAKSTGPCTSSWNTKAEVCQGDQWLAANLPAILSDGGANDVTVLIVWDEGSTSLGGGGHTLMIETGAGVCLGCADASNINDYGVLSGIEDWFALPELGPRSPNL